MQRIASWFLGCVLAVGTAALSTGCGGGGGHDGSGPLDVLVVHASTYVDDVTSKLVASGEFTSVVEFDAGSGTPSLKTLQLYDAVLVMSDEDFADSSTLGDNLADYVDGGGGVVLCEFTMSSAGSDTAEGRFATDDYYVIPRTDSNGSGTGPFGFIVLDGGHPILDGVSTFSGGTSSYRPEGAVVPGAYDLIASWDDGGTPLVATREIGGVRRADLGFYPPTTDTGRTDFVDASTDAMRIVVNALRWVGRDL